MKKVIILSRVSTDNQDLCQQTQYILNRVLNDGYKYEEIHIIEDKESGIKLSEEERNGINKLKEFIELNSHSIKCIYIYELSRLSRRQKDLFSIRDYLIDKKIQLISLQPELKLLDDNGKQSQLSSLLFSLMSSLSESEMMIKKERMIRGMRYNRSIGKIGGGIPPFGYTTNKDKYYIEHNEESEILRRIFREYGNTDKSLRIITRDLKEEGYFPNTSESTLYSELQKWTKDKRYLGNTTFPPIISQKEFDLCMESRKRHITLHKTRNSQNWLLKGLIYDIEIGMMIGTFCIHKKTHIYQYTSYNRELNKSHSVSKKRVDPVVWEESKKLYKKYIINKKNHIKEIEKELESISKKITNINKDIEIIQNKIDKTEERFIDGYLSKLGHSKKITSLLSEQKNKKSRLIDLSNEYSYKQGQIKEIELSKELNLDNLTQIEKIDITHKVIDIISFKRINRHKSIICIYNKFNNKVLVYQINTFGKIPYIKLEERLEEPNERPQKNNRPKEMCSYNYKGELIKGLKNFT